MVKTIYRNMPGGGVRIGIEGHAGAGPKGADPVCAAVSMLVYTAAGVALELAEQGRLKGEPRIRLEPGSSEIIVRPRRGSMSRVDQRLRFVKLGFRLLARRYPGNVCTET